MVEKRKNTKKSCWRSRSGIILFVCLFFRIALLPSPSLAQIPPAGQVISSRSSAGYDDNGNFLTISSNEVTLRVLPVFSPLLVPDGTSASPAGILRAFSGERVTFPYRITNTGNADDTFDLGIFTRAPSDFVASSTTVYLDEDGDSFIDPGEQQITSVGPLASNEFASLIIEAELPSGLTGGEISHIDLTARSAGDTSAYDEGNVFRIVARDEARVQLVLESDVTSVMPGGAVTYTMRFSNAGERAATDVIVANYIDYNGILTGTELVPGSVSAGPPGTIEYYDATTSQWVTTAPPPDRIKGTRIRLATLAQSASGSLSFSVTVNDDCEWGEILNTAEVDFTGGDGIGYHSVSNVIAVRVGRVSDLAIGPEGNPTADNQLDDRVIVTLNGGDTTCTFWYELLNDGNYDDTVSVVVADSVLLLPGWRVQFVDSMGNDLPHFSSYSAGLGCVRRGASCVVGLRLQAGLEQLRRFAGREFVFDIEAQSFVESESRDRVRSVLIKTDIPLISVTQSIKEPTAMVGDILSYIVTVENLTGETAIDSIVLMENLSSGLGFAGGSDVPSIAGNGLRWELGSLQPGEKREVVFRARVKAGQEWGRLDCIARVSGVTEFGERASDGPAITSVQIVDGVFTRRGILLGAVFEDLDDDGVYDRGEAGVSGISVFIEDGTYAVTDSSGLYSIPGVFEGTHVVRIDPTTLPDSLVPGKPAYFGLGIRGELLIDMAPSGNRRVDFPLVRNPDESRGGTATSSGGSAHAVIPTGAETGELFEGGRVPGTGEGANTGSAPGVSGVADAAGPALGISGAAGAAHSTSPSVPGAAGAAHSTSPSTEASKEGLAAIEGFEALTIPSTQFAPGSSYLEEIPLSQIAALALWINEHPGWIISIAGHTDSIAINTTEFPSNFELSLSRARSIYQLLRMNGIDEASIDYTGCGSRKPVASNDTPEGRAANRRVDINVIPPPGYDEGDPELPGIINKPDTIAYSLADDAGICAEIVLPREGRVYYQKDKINVEITSPLGSAVELYVNNVPVGREKVGQKKVDVKNGSIGFIFYDVKIKVGKNDILVVCKEHGGGRLTCVRHVYLAGKPAGMRPEVERVSAPADGSTSPEIVFLVNDEVGLPVRDGMFATVSGPTDLLRDLDRNPHQNGVQIPTRNGMVIISMPPLREARRDRVHVSLDGLSSSCLVSYESPLRRWFLFGYGEGSLGYSNLTGSGVPHRSIERHHDGFFAEGKIALYGQGEIRGGHLLTCAVDTRPFVEDKLFERIEPEKYYPIYGDAGELKFNTASRSGTYIRLDHRRYSAMYGDFRTDLCDMEFTSYYRSFNGFEGEAVLDRLAVRAFVTETDQVIYQEELRAEGTSGFYFLSNCPLVENSEKIRIEVRDRYQTEKILRIEYKQINRDYEVNYMDGSILFKEPIPATDEFFNPVIIVVSYECRNAGEYNFTYGLRASALVTDSLALGMTAVLEEEGVENYSLVGVDLSGRLHKEIALMSEFAHSEKFLLGSGNAFRMQFIGNHDFGVKWNAYYRRIDEDFFNPSFTGGKTELGSTKVGADLDWQVGSTFMVTSRAYHHEFMERSEKKGYYDLNAVYKAGTLRWRVGLAGAEHSDTREGDHSSTLLLAGIGVAHGNFSGELSLDKIIAGEEVQEYPNRIQAKLSRRLWRFVTGTLNYEYRTGSRSGTRHLTQLGIESRVTENLHLFSRYRLEGAMSGERGQATIGLRNRFRVSRDLSGTVSFEKTATVSGAQAGDFTSFATGWIYTPAEKDYRLKGDYEIRLEPDRRKHLAGVGWLKRLSERWAGLLKGGLWYNDEKRDKDGVKGSGTIGLSFRPRAAGRLNLLALLRTHYEKNSPAHPDGVDKELIASIEANYIVNTRWELEGKVAARWVNNTFDTYSATTLERKLYMASSSSFLYQAQVIRILGSKWDIRLVGRVEQQRETHTIRYGGGLELGRLIAENLWLGVGYDFGGHEDRDASINDFRRSGFHVRLRLKFSEKLEKYFYGK